MEAIFTIFSLYLWGIFLHLHILFYEFEGKAIKNLSEIVFSIAYLWLCMQQQRQLFVANFISLLLLLARLLSPAMLLLLERRCAYLAAIWQSCYLFEDFFFFLFFFALRLNLSILCYLCIAPIHQPTATTKTRAQHWAPQHIHTCISKSLHITVYQYLFVCVCVREQVCMHMLVFT